MLPEKIAVDFDVFEGGPLLDVNGIGVEAVNLGAKAHLSTHRFFGQ